MGLKDADIYILGGHQNLNQGYSDRTYSTVFANMYYNNGMGIHAELLNMNREEDSSYIAAGLSYITGNHSIKAIIGTSTDNDGILPELLIRGEISYKTSPEIGFVFTPSVTHRRYRNTAEEVSLDTNATKYFSVGYGKSLILQAFGRVVFSTPGNKTSPSGGIDFTFSEHKKYSMGLTFEGGKSSYSSVLDLSEIGLSYYSVRPHVGIFLNKNMELTISGEYTDLNDYEILGGNAGIKYHF
ncbi:MAG: YaiO family outer membrane beta-barrel protein [Methyloligellaceae bacterium]